MKPNGLVVLLAVAAAAALALSGCSDATNPEASGGVGRISLNLIDAPGDYEAVNVQIVGVRVHRADADDSNSGWFDIAVDTTEVDLLTLSGGNYLDLADSTLPAGRYTQIRLLLGDANNVVVDGEAHDLRIPSSAQTGLKLNHPFTIESGATYAATLDFDADRSVHVTGNGRYMMKPVIRIIVDQTSGALQGVVEPVDARAMIWTVAGDDTVTAYADTLSGGFAFGMLPAGSYDLNIAATAGAYADTVLGGVAVAAGQTTDVGTVTLQAE
jgi:hypothetical protein